MFLPDDKLHEWVTAGLRTRDILVKLEEMGIQTRSTSITSWKRRHGYALRQSTPERLALIPWKVRVEHNSDPIYKALSAEARRRAGKDLPRPDQRRLANFATTITGLDGDFVVHYDRENGFVLVPRRPGIDEDWIRDPRWTDGGNAIEDSELWQ